MNNFKPTDEQLFDYFSDDLNDDVLKANIANYITRHPEIAEEFNDWKNLENQYSQTLQFEPSQATLEKVKLNAEKLLSSQPSFWQTLNTAFPIKRFSLAFGILGVGLLSLFVTRLYFPQKMQSGLAIQNPTTLQTNHLASTANTQTQTVVSAIDPVREAWAQGEFKIATSLFENGEYARANEKFTEIIARYEEFSERKKLYLYWIKTLEELGQYDVAAQKKIIADKIP